MRLGSDFDHLAVQRRVPRGAHIARPLDHHYAEASQEERTVATALAFLLRRTPEDALALLQEFCCIRGRNPRGAIKEAYADRGGIDLATVGAWAREARGPLAEPEAAIQECIAALQGHFGWQARHALFRVALAAKEKALHTLDVAHAACGEGISTFAAWRRGGVAAVQADAYTPVFVQPSGRLWAVAHLLPPLDMPEEQDGQAVLAEMAAVTELKEQLMRARGWSEELAYRTIQRFAMTHGVTKSVMARALLARKGVTPRA